MNAADLKAHAKEFVETHCPHLKGEFQAFVDWIEGKRKPVAETAVDPGPAASPAAAPASRVEAQ